MSVLGAPPNVRLGNFVLTLKHQDVDWTGHFRGHRREIRPETLRIAEISTAGQTAYQVPVTSSGEA